MPLADTIIYDSICVMEKKYSVVLTAKTKKMIRKMPVEIQDVFTLIVEIYYAGSRENAPY